jgi:hypothetical protein
VWIDVDTELGAKHMLNKCMALRCGARWSVRCRLFTNDCEKLGATLGTKLLTKALMNRE